MSTTTSTVITARRARAVALAGVGGVLFYVAAWAIGGLVWPEYDPARQAISELFAIGAPDATRAPMLLGLAVSGMGLVAFGWALDVALPGQSRAGPVLASLSGVMILGVMAFPCTAGCPGYGHSLTDTMHVYVAGAGYIALILAPLAIAQRVRVHEPSFARVSWLIGGTALVLFVAANLGVVAGWEGVQQRLYNTIADAWYVLAAAVIVRRTEANPSRSPDHPTPSR